MKTIKIVASLLFIIWTGLISANSSDEEFLPRHNGMINNTPLETMPEGIWVSKPDGRLFFNNEYFGTEFKYELNKPVKCYGLFSQNMDFSSTYDIYKAGDKNLILQSCNYTIVFDSTDNWKPYKLEVDNSELAGVMFFLIEGIELNSVNGVKTWFIGKESFFKRTSNHPHDITSLLYQTEYGDLKIYPDTTKIVDYEKKLPDNGFIRERIAPYYVSFGVKKTLIKRDIYYGNKGDPGVLWVGNLDSDNIPDMLIDISTHYAGGHYLLLMSSLAKEDELYGLAGRLRTASC